LVLAVTRASGELQVRRDRPPRLEERRDAVAVVVRGGFSGGVVLPDGVVRVRYVRRATPVAGRPLAVGADHEVERPAQVRVQADFLGEYPVVFPLRIEDLGEGTEVRAVGA